MNRSAQLMEVVIRRGPDLEVKPESELIDGNQYIFRPGWVIDEDDSRYPGEIAWIPEDATYPSEAPAWIASGDLRSGSALM